MVWPQKLNANSECSGSVVINLKIPIEKLIFNFFITAYNCIHITHTYVLVVMDSTTAFNIIYYVSAKDKDILEL